MRVAAVLLIGLLSARCASFTGLVGSNETATWAWRRTPAPDKPQLLAIGTLSTGLDERDFAMAPHGQRAVFTVWTGDTGTLVEVTEAEPRPRALPFSGRHSDLEPFFAGDGTLYFASKRPLPGTTTDDYNIWSVAFGPQGWGRPVPVAGAVNSSADEFYPSLTRDGTLYFTTVDPDGKGKDDIYRAPRSSDGTYPRRERLPEPVNSESWEFNAAVDPDERFLIYSVAGRLDGPGRGDLVVSFRSADGQWSTPRLIDINSPALDYCPSISPDGRTLFFTSRRAFERNPDEARTYAGLKERLLQPGNGSGDLYRVSRSVIGASPH